MPLDRNNPAASQWTEEELKATEQHIIKSMRDSHAFITSLSQMCPRAAVITGIARIDYEIELLLRSIIDGETTPKEDKLFTPDRPLGPYSARCELCFRLGLIDEHFVRALRMYGKIRNRFAHYFGLLTFVDSPLKEWLQEIENIVAVNDDTSPDGESFRKMREHPFHRFTIPLGLILSMLMRLRFETPRFQPVFTATIVFKQPIA